MSVSGALNAARSGLQTSSLRAEMVALNVSNASTPGYVRRSVDISETILAGKTTGVRPNGVARSDLPQLTAERRLASADRAQQEALSETWQMLGARIGTSIETSHLFNAMSDFDTALQSAAASPESSAQASRLLDSGKALVAELNGLSGMVASLRGQADRNLSEGVDAVNQALRSVQELNVKIMSVDRSTTQAAALLDERDRELDTIAEYLPIRTVERQAGAIDVLTEQGVYLVAGSARQISFSGSIDFRADRTYAGGALSGLSVEGVDLTPGAATFGAISGGRLSALFQLRDQDLPALGAQLDVMANDLVSRFSDDSIDPTKAPGAPGLFVDSDPSAGSGLAGRIAIHAAIDPAQGGEIHRLRDGIGSASPGLPGNSTILSGLSQALRAVNGINAAGFQGSFSAPELAAQFSTMTGQSRLGYDAALASTRTQHDFLSGIEHAETVVDIDAQMQELLLIEQAYAANARVIEVAGQLINRLMDL